MRQVYNPAACRVFTAPIPAVEMPRIIEGLWFFGNDELRIYSPQKSDFQPVTVPDTWSPPMWAALPLLFLIGPLAYYSIWYHRVMSGARRDLEKLKEE